MERVNLSTVLGMEVLKTLKSKGIEPRKDENGLISLSFAQEELDKLLKKLNLTKAQFLRNAIEELKNKAK